MPIIPPSPRNFVVTYSLADLVRGWADGRRGGGVGGRGGRRLFLPLGAPSLRGCLLRLLPGGLPFRRLAGLAAGILFDLPLRLLVGIHRRQHVIVRASVVVAARYRGRLCHPARGGHSALPGPEAAPVRSRTSRSVSSCSGWPRRGHLCGARLIRPTFADDHALVQTLARRLLSRGSHPPLRGQPRDAIEDFRLATFRRAVPLRRVPDTGTDLAGGGHLFLLRLRRRAGAPGGLLHRPRGVCPGGVVLGWLAGLAACAALISCPMASSRGCATPSCRITGSPRSRPAPATVWPCWPWPGCSCCADAPRATADRCWPAG